MDQHVKNNNGDSPTTPEIRFHNTPKGKANEISKILQKKYDDTKVRVEAITPDRIFVYGIDYVHQDIAKYLKDYGKKKSPIGGKPKQPAPKKAHS